MKDVSRQEIVDSARERSQDHRQGRTRRRGTVTWVMIGLGLLLIMLVIGVPILINSR